MKSSKSFGLETKALLALDVGPWDIISRGALGFGLTPAYSAIGGAQQGFWTLLGFLVLVLAATRIVPAVIRHVLPFSREVKQIWEDRRALAKRYDAYQWRKLLGVGVGWYAYLALQGHGFSAANAIALVCIAIGSAASVAWRRQQRTIRMDVGPTTGISSAT